MLGHVNHARALALIEDARMAMVDGGGGLILARLEVDYLRQLYYRVGERLVVRSAVTRLGTKSFTVQQDQVASRANAVMVAFDFEADASRPLTDDERRRWSEFAAA